MPRKPAWIPLLFLLAGLATTLTAVFADTLGIDPSAGWGRARIALLSAGVIITICAAVGWRASKNGLPLRHRVQQFLGDRLGTAGDARTASNTKLLGTLKNYWGALPVCALVILIYVWSASSGTWTTWTSPTRYYADLARGFQQGHLYLATKVNPNLLTSPDPYQPYPNGATQGPLDVSYYKGKYYLPWGPVPAIIVLLFRGLLHWWLGDLQLTFGFLCGVFLLQVCMVLMIRQMYFGSQPKWLLWLALLFVGLAGPATFMLANYKSARIYEASVAGGQFFFLGGLLTTFLALRRPSAYLTLGLAGTFWALAIATRINLAIPVGLASVMVMIRVLKSQGWSAKPIAACLTLGLPLVVGCALVGWYNWARFGSVMEGGYYYQLAGINLQDRWGHLFSASYIFSNLYNYLLNPFQASAKFPFLIATYGQTPAVFSVASVSRYYYTQMIAGILWTAPFAVFAVPPFIRLAGTSLRGRKSAGLNGEEDPGFLYWITVTLYVCFLGSFAFLLVFFWAAMRYTEDFMPALMVLSIIGFWDAYQRIPQKTAWRWFYSTLGILLVTASVFMSTLGAVSVNNARFGLISFFSSFGR